MTSSGLDGSLAIDWAASGVRGRARAALVRSGAGSPVVFAVA